MLKLKQISKRFGELQALHPMDLEIPRGQLTALLGPSGCGKSTLLRIVVGLILPDTGEVWLDGQRVTPENLREIRLRIGYLIQDGGLFPHLTIADNVALMARRLKWGRDAIQRRLEELTQLTHLNPDLWKRLPRQVSGGQRQRAALMRALFLDPDLLVLDEPMGALDPLIRSELQQELREIFRRLGKTVVLVTHDIGEAGFLADQIALLRNGQILQRGALADLVRRPADPFVVDFINAQRSPLETLETLEEPSS